MATAKVPKMDCEIFAPTLRPQHEQRFMDANISPGLSNKSVENVLTGKDFHRCIGHGELMVQNDHTVKY